MNKNVIMRVAWNRPEMLQVSIEHEIEARKYHMLPSEFTTLFIIEYGASSKVLDIVNEYPFEKQIIIREFRHGLTENILEGMKVAFNMADDYIVYIEDDICIHKTYFKYMDLLLERLKDKRFSVLLGFNHNDDGNVNEVYKSHFYCAWGALINKDFYTRYIYPCSNKTYYSNKSQFVVSLNAKYSKYWESRKYKYNNNTHWEQAGAINRLVDAIMIDEDVWTYMPKVNRQMHIGFVGKNRNGLLPGKSFEERIINLKKIIKDPNEMYRHTKSKQYNDYKVFSTKLNGWDETLEIKG